MKARIQLVKMRSLTFSACLVILTMNAVSAQNLELRGGLNLNKLVDSGYDDWAQTNYSINSNISFGIGYITREKGWFSMRFRVSYDNYKGSIDETSGGKQFSTSIDSDFKKNIISLDICPVNILVKEKIGFNIGFVISCLINETITGIERHTFYDVLTLLPTKTTVMDLSELTNFSPGIYFGLKAGIDYRIDITESVRFMLQYSAYFRLTNEFRRFETNLKLISNYLGIGCLIDLRTKE